ncbi:MAG: hypothetical protein ACPHIC_00955 [Acidimicrobiales bacterium]
MSSSFSVISLVLALVTGAICLRGPWLQPRLERATNPDQNGRRSLRYEDQRLVAFQQRLRTNATTIALDSLRALGIVRRRVDRPIVGRRAYVRWWERIRALIVLSAIVVGLGIALAVIIGVIVLSAGFLLERAIS